MAQHETGPMYSDSGAQCGCGGTCYRYMVTSPLTGAVQTYCYTCHATVDHAFFLDALPTDVREVSAAHRANC